MQVSLRHYVMVIQQDEQVVDGKSYTDYTQDNFDCGRFEDDKDKINQGEEAPDLEFGINYGATCINDRYLFEINILPCKSNKSYLQVDIDCSTLH